MNTHTQVGPSRSPASDQVSDSSFLHAGSSASDSSSHDQRHLLTQLQTTASQSTIGRSLDLSHTFCASSVLFYARVQCSHQKPPTFR
eukprot:762082-Hanusia_phi.AAC.1